MAQHEFGDVASGAAETMLEDGFCAVFCKTGFHRAATVGETSAALLNYTGHQALHLALAGEAIADIHHSVEVAQRWMMAPWATAQTWQWPMLKAKTITRPESWKTAEQLEVSRYTFKIALLMVLVEF
jgi:hypothetical protein